MPLCRALAVCTSRSHTEEGGATLGELAMRLGYQSEAAFSRAFKRFIGFRQARPGGTATRPNGQHTALAGS